MYLKLNNMKKIILCVLFLVIGLAAKAQYSYFNPYVYAAAAAETNETYQLNNIRFDENALKTNETAWKAYNDYLSINAQFAKKNKVYSILGWSGLGLSCASIIPFCLNTNDLNPEDDPAFIAGASMLTVGCAVACVGLIGMAVQVNKIKVNKKEFIYYLKTTHNGIGIVSIF